MRNFVQVTAVFVIIASSFAVLLNVIVLASTGGDKVQALIVIACAMFGYLAAGISWVLMDVAGALLQRLAPQNQTLPLG
jgi:hypothetical protein